MARKSGGIYYGWILMVMCMICLLLAIGTTINAFPLFVLPVSEAYGLSRASMNTGMILITAGSAVAALVVGRLLDKYSIRLIMRISAVMLAVSLITLGLSTNLWLSAAILCLPVGFALSGVGTLTCPALMARWFTVHRGRAMAITVMGMSAATIVVVPPLAWLIDTVGWRSSLVTMGCTVGVVLLAISVFIRNAPGPDDHEVAETPATIDRPVAPVVEGEPMTVGQLFALPRFWMIGVSMALVMGCIQGTMLSLVPMGHGAGFSTTKSATLISVMGSAALAAKFLVAMVGDRVDRALTLAAMFVLIAAANLAFFWADTYAVMLVGCVLMGIASGFIKPLYLALLADQFGTRSFGTANGYLTFMMAVLGACAARFSGEVYDRTGGYDAMFLTFAALTLICAFLMAPLRRGSRPKVAAPAAEAVVAR